MPRRRDKNFMCALAVLEAKIHVTGPRGDREIAFADFHRLPGDTPQRATPISTRMNSSTRSSCRRADLRATVLTADSLCARRQGRRHTGIADARSHRHDLAVREAFARKDTIRGGVLYKCPNTRFTHKLVPLDVTTPADMRAPGAATGIYGLECAMDELAVALKRDPIEAAYSQLLGARSERRSSLYQQGATRMLPARRRGLRLGEAQSGAAFDARRQRVGRPRDGRRCLGGAGSPVYRPRCADCDGHAEMSCATFDIGTGTCTVMTQIAADTLGLPLENVSARLGGSTLPHAPVEGGSWTAASIAKAIVAACNEVKAELLRLGQAAPDSPLAASEPDEFVLVDGNITSKRDPSRALPIAEAMRRGGVDRIEREKSNAPGKENTHARAVHSAVFAEVNIHEQIGVVRVRRVVSAIAAGHVINAKTARSQILGSVVMSIGMALQEETVTDQRFGRIMNANFAEYHVPVNADVNDIEVIFCRGTGRDHQPARHQGRRRDRHRWRRGRDRQRGLSRHGQAHSRFADYAG
jgi:xanthine dehydrogenase YagR molybdenum-binding subunit